MCNTFHSLLYIWLGCIYCTYIRNQTLQQELWQQDKTAVKAHHCNLHPTHSSILWICMYMCVYAYVLHAYVYVFSHSSVWHYHIFNLFWINYFTSITYTYISIVTSTRTNYIITKEQKENDSNISTLHRDKTDTLRKTFNI